MTEQSPNDQFKASSFMQGHNAAYLEQLYALYAKDPTAVDAAWQTFFAELGDDNVFERPGQELARDRARRRRTHCTDDQDRFPQRPLPPAAESVTLAPAAAFCKMSAKSRSTAPMSRSPSSST